MLKRLTYKQTENLLGALTALIGFLVYWKTLCPTVNFIDSGELATVCQTMSIAHPTGYPLFTILGHLFSLLPFGLRPIYQLNLFAAVLCSAGLFFYFKFIAFFLNEYVQKGRGQQKNVQENSLLAFLPAFCATLIVGFSETFWSQALSIEVYSLHILFLALLLFTFTKAIKSDAENVERKEGRGNSTYWFLFAFVLGLSFTNHLSTIFLAPGFLAAYFYTSGFSKHAFKRLIVLAVPFIAGFSVYLYLLLRASQQPTLNWGNPSEIEKLIWHLSGKVYRVWFLESGESIMKQFKFFIVTLPAESAYVGAFLALVGLKRLFKESRMGLVFTALLFLSCAVFASFYDIHDIETYFLLAYLTLGIWIGFGVKHLLEMKLDAGYKKGIAVVSVVLVIVVASFNYNNVDESKTTIVETYARDMLQSIKPNGIVISFQWDYFVSAAYYLQQVEGFREDVVIIDKELLRRSWYYPQLKNHYPWLIEQSKPELDNFLKELYKFEHEMPYDGSSIEYRYTALIHSFIEKNWNSRPVYVTPEIEQQYINNYKKIPSGLALRLYPLADSLFPQPEPIEFHVTIPGRFDKYRSGIVSLYSQAYMNHSYYLQYLNKPVEANEMMAKAKELETFIQRVE